MEQNGDDDGLRFGPIGRRTVHLCIDMQNLFGLKTAWHAPRMSTVLPNVARIARAHPAQTMFTRFIPARNAEAARGAWRGYYEHWHAMTLDELDPGLIDLMPPLDQFVPPAGVLDKTTYGPWLDGALAADLEGRRTDTLVITGGETDVCVLGAVLGAVDRGYRTIVVADALCSSSNESHDATMQLYRSRFDQQIETVRTDAVLEAWDIP